MQTAEMKTDTAQIILVCFLSLLLLHYLAIPCGEEVAWANFKTRALIFFFFLERVICDIC